MATNPVRTSTDDMKEYREERIVVVVTVTEKRKFEKMAKASFTNLSEFVRQLLHKEAEQKSKAVKA